MRQRFCERVLGLPKKTDIVDYEIKHRKWLNLELMKRIAGCVVIDESEVSSVLLKHIKEKHRSNYTMKFYLGGKIIYLATMCPDKYDTNETVKPTFVTCYKKDGSVGEYYLQELYNRYDVLKKSYWWSIKPFFKLYCTAAFCMSSTSLIFSTLFSLVFSISSTCTAKV